MIVTTTDGIAGRMIEDTLGLVRTTVLWARRVTKNSMGGIRQFQVNSLKDLDHGLSEAKEQASRSVADQAREKGADAIIGMRLEVVEMSNGVYCINATGTAVKTLNLPMSVPSYAPPPAPEAEPDFDWSFLPARMIYQGSSLRH